ncbi:hypothetical protein [Micromonospora sp. NPDC047187]|uniref:hypothetical protein n=1 Tax=Micromonospora sp. NPDC047187 TaxID=3155262 RepID=UPI00341082A4
MKLVLRAMIEIMHAVRDGSESSARAIRMCVLYVIFVSGFVATLWLVTILGI